MSHLGTREVLTYRRLSYPSFEPGRASRKVYSVQYAGAEGVQAVVGSGEGCNTVEIDVVDDMVTRLEREKIHEKMRDLKFAGHLCGI